MILLCNHVIYAVLEIKTKEAHNKNPNSRPMNDSKGTPFPFLKETQCLLNVQCFPDKLELTYHLGSVYIVSVQISDYVIQNIHCLH